MVTARTEVAQASTRVPSLLSSMDTRSVCSDKSLDVPAQYIYLWEHACLLFDNFDWESALRIFDLLVPQTTCPRRSTVLLINIGITLCHLGYFSRARAVLEEAVALWNTFPMAHYPLGIVQYELSLYEAARLAFAAAALDLRNAHISTLDHCLLGLEYSISVSQLEDNEVSAAYASTLVDKTGRGYPVLHRLPAGLIFRMSTSVVFPAADSIQPQNDSNVTNSGVPASYQTHLVNNQSTKCLHEIAPPNPSQDRLLTTLYKRSRRSRSQPCNSVDTKLCEHRPDLHLLTNSTLLKRFASRLNKAKEASINIRESPVVEVSGSQTLSAIPTPPLSQAKVMPRMVPREARTESISLHEISNAIRHTGPEYANGVSCGAGSMPSSKDHLPGVETRHQPRDAAPKLENMTDLVSFLKGDGIAGKCSKIYTSLPAATKTHVHNSEASLEYRDTRPHSEVSGKCTNPSTSEPRNDTVFLPRSRYVPQKSCLEHQDVRPYPGDPYTNLEDKKFLDEAAILPRARYVPPKHRNTRPKPETSSEVTPVSNNSDVCEGSTIMQNRVHASAYIASDTSNESPRIDSCLHESTAPLLRQSCHRPASSVYSRLVDVSYPWERGDDAPPTPLDTSDDDAMPDAYDMVCRFLESMARELPDDESQPYNFEHEVPSRGQSGENTSGAESRHPTDDSGLEEFMESLHFERERALMWLEGRH